MPEAYRYTAIKFKSLSFTTPHWLYALHRFLFRLTNGLWNDTMGFLLRMINGKYREIVASPSVIACAQEDITEIVNHLDDEGYCILKHRLPEELVEKLVQISMATPVKCVMPTDDYSKGGSQFTQQEISVESARNKSARCVHDTNSILRHQDIQKIALDPTLLRIAQGYLGIKPILNSVAMWWSFSVEDKKSFAAAAGQEFHFDMDRLGFFNFFIYLTDVGENNGPHMFVKGSHKRLPKMFRRRGRFDDKTVADYYGKNVLELKGKKGTIMAVDTRGLHKGKILESGARLILQIGFANSLFGEHYPKATIQNVDDNLKDHVQKHLHTYFNFL